MPRRGSSRKPLRGYTKVGKSRWRTPNGIEISDYEYRSRRARKAGWKNYSEVEKWRKSPFGKEFRFDILNSSSNYDTNGDYIGPDLTYHNRLWHDWKVVHDKQVRGEKFTTHGQRQRADKSALGRMLIALGKLPIDFEWEYA